MGRRGRHRANDGRDHGRTGVRTRALRPGGGPDDPHAATERPSGRQHDVHRRDLRRDRRVSAGHDGRCRADAVRGVPQRPPADVQQDDRHRRRRPQPRSRRLLQLGDDRSPRWRDQLHHLSAGPLRPSDRALDPDHRRRPQLDAVQHRRHPESHPDRGVGCRQRRRHHGRHRLDLLFRAAGHRRRRPVDRRVPRLPVARRRCQCALHRRQHVQHVNICVPQGDRLRGPEELDPERRPDRRHRVPRDRAGQRLGRASLTAGGGQLRPGRERGVLHRRQQRGVRPVDPAANQRSRRHARHLRQTLP